ncbi:MAG TPA: ABC transporter substrate-binding protein [Candidatus Atribacteria bacterium]|nr:ABC transporter substrate-binding protein [Candidatus Atribacteria bacterium]
MKTKRLTLMLILVVFSILFVFNSGWTAANEVVVYTALEEDESADYFELAAKELPDLNIKWIRYSTGELMAKVLAEKNNPQADVIYGTAVTELARVKDILEPYKPKDIDKIGKEYKDPDGYWTAIDMYVAAFCVNTKRLSEKNLTMPTSWADLTRPEYKGEIIMPNPASSGTGYLQVTSLLLMGGIKEGKEDGWEYLKKLDNNIVEYTNSGSAPAKLASTGEIAIGISFGYRVARQKSEGYPVEMVFPAEGAGYELEANALLKGTKNPEAAKMFLDWAISENAMKAYSKYKIMVTREGITSQATLPLPKPEEVKLAKMDFDWSAMNKTQLMEKWNALFVAKTEPK